jgi:hypothetical protein
MSQNTAIFARPAWYENCELGMQFHEQSGSLMCLYTWSYYFRKKYKLQVYCNVKNFNRKYLVLNEMD